MIRLAILTTDPELRSRLRYLASSSRIEVVADQHRMDDAARADVLIVDERDAAAAEVEWPAGLIVVGDTPAALRLARTIGVSARGIVPRDVDRVQLQASIEAVAAGLTVMPPPLADRVTPGSSDETPDTADEPLTRRELDVLALVAEGLPNRDVARELGISEHTVKFHLAAVYGKLRASTRTEAVRHALRRGLIEL